MFTYEYLKDNLQNIKENIKAEYFDIHLSTLGGRENASILIRLSVDKKETWENNIFHNSRYYMFHIDKNGSVENFSRGQNTNKIRKKIVKTIEKAIEYINEKIKKV